MATFKRVLSTCRSCDGSKVNEIYEDGILVDTIPCVSCGGTGFWEKEWIEFCTDNVFESYKLLECLDVAEYNALSDAQKASFHNLLNVGRVDLNDGKVGKGTLWVLFGAESTTVANLTELLV